MKKISVLVIVFSFIAVSLHAQTWDEWFKQKKTQIKYLTQQVAALQVYEGYVSKGYQIAKGGLQTISKIKNGEFTLHEAFFSSLTHINPSLQQYSRIADIIALQLNINKQYKRYYESANQSNQSNQLHSNERQYINSVFISLLQNCTNDISDLITLLTDGQLRLEDDERLQRIDAIYKNMLNKYGFAQTFSRQVNILTLNRQKEGVETSSLQSLYNLK